MKLILLSVSFPYGNTEQFLEIEIKYLAEKFDEVIIIPAVAKGQMRPVPDNIIIDNRFAQNNTMFKTIMSALRTINIYHELIKEPKILLSITKLQRLFSFMGRGNAEYNYLKKYYTHEELYYSYWFNGSSYALYLLHMKEGVKYTFRAHGSDLYLDVNGGYLPFRKKVIKEAERVFCISEDGVNYMKKNYASELQTPIIVSRLGTYSLSPSFTRKELQPDNQLHLVSCAHLSRVKRVDILISALKLLGNANPLSQIFWTHIGAGDLFEDIQEMSHQLPKNIRVTFMGHMDNKNILEFYAKNNFELFINSSESEGIPVTFMEAMSFGIPVMAPAVGGITEIINDENGFLLPKEINSTILYKELQIVLKNKQFLRDKRIKARVSWQEKYNAEKNYRDFSNSLKEIILESRIK